MNATYAVTWRVGTGPLCVGKLQLGPSIDLVGTTDAGAHAQESLPLEPRPVVRRATNGARLRGLRTLLLVPVAGETVAIASLDGPGTTLELTERLAAPA